jgi:hypothetical protein
VGTGERLGGASWAFVLSLKICFLMDAFFFPSFSANSTGTVDYPSTIQSHNTQAHRIQESGRVFAERILTDAQNDCYWFAVLLEWGALWGEG